MGIRLFFCAAFAAVLTLQPVHAAPTDAKVGVARAVFKKEGTVLREKPSALAATEADEAKPEDGPVAWLRGLLAALEAGTEPAPWSGIVRLHGK